MAGRISSKMKAKRAGKSNSDKASDKSEEEFDTSILNKPLETSINNLAKILKLYQTTTEEIRGYIVKECDILYECRVCRSIFRSLSNFILHKRLFCEKKFDHQNRQWPRKDEDDEYLDVIIKDTAATTTDQNVDAKNSKKDLNSIIESLAQKKQFGFDIGSFSIEEFYKQNQGAFNNPIASINKKLNLEQIQGSSTAVFQTLNIGNESRSKIDDIKLEAMELQQLTEGQTAILGPDGKVVNINQSKQMPIEDNSDNSELTCKKCNITFTTRKTFLSHVKYKHDSSRLVYPCLECSDTFVSVWSVYRHLYNIHRKTLPEVRKMRSKIQAKAYRRNEDSAKKKDKEKSAEGKKDSGNMQQNIDELNQEWMDNFESDNDIQMCGGCGRRFERRAALNSHSQTCQKRIAAKNIINLNKQKRIAAAEEKHIDKKPNKLCRTESEADKKFYDSHNVTKKRKIGIQIRCDYSKPVDKSQLKTDDNNSTVKKSSTSITNYDDDKKQIQSNEKPKYLLTYVNKSVLQEVDELPDAEVVSIPSSNSSPSKDDTDPLALKDSPSASDSEIEEILGPISSDICDADGGGVPTSDSFEIKNQLEHVDDDDDDNDDENKMKLSNINETTLKLIELINSDIKMEKLRPTLDEKMANYVNLKKVLCVPCDIKFGSIPKLRHHMSTHFNWWRFRCDICAFKAYDKSDVIEHVKEQHTIQNTEKIDSIIFLIPDWETYELSSKDFLVQQTDSHHNNIPVSASSSEEDKTCVRDVDSCIIIEPEPDDKTNILIGMKGKVSKKNRGAKNMKTKNKNTDIKIKETFNDGRSDNSEASDNDPGGSSSSSNSQDLRKMVYEVIFGDVTKSNNASMSNSSSEEKDNLHVVTSTDVSNVISRPVRNRVKHIDKDFIYDLSEFKEQQKTVLVSNTNRSSFIKSVSNQISELLEDNMVMVSGTGNKYNKKCAITNKSDKNSSKRYLENMGNIVKTLNLQKKTLTKFDTSSHNQGYGGLINTEEFSRDKVTLVDPKTFLNDNISEGDDDIYIVENEELVAVK